MAIGVFSLGMTLGSFCWWLVLVFCPAGWQRFMAVENRVSLSLGVPAKLASWLHRHETGITLKVIVLLQTVVSAMCVMEASRLLR
jgi:hypothetical protein